jgi:hypothetical protein
MFNISYSSVENEQHNKHLFITSGCFSESSSASFFNSPTCYEKKGDFQLTK